MHNLVRIRVRNALDHSHYLGRHGWTHSIRWARRFSSTQAAVHFCLERDIRDAEVTINFGVISAAVVVVSVPEEIPADIGLCAEWLLSEGL